MFRTSRTARRSHAPLACVGRWTRPARGRSRAAWIVGLAAHPSWPPWHLPPSQPLPRGGRSTRTGVLAITRRWNSVCRRVAAGSPTSTLPCSCRAPTGGGRSDRSCGLRAFPDPRECPSNATEPSPRLRRSRTLRSLRGHGGVLALGQVHPQGKAARVVVRARHVGEAGTVCDSGDRQRHRPASDKPSVRGHVLARESSSVRRRSGPSWARGRAS